MEELEFPISYTDDLEEIYFTYLKNGLEGDYDSYNNKIRIGCNKHIIDRTYQIFVHEIGHHIDEIEGFSEEQELKDEFDLFPGIMPICLSTCFEESPSGLSGEGRYGEYFALGFELYHSHDRGLSDSYPVLFKMIDDLYKRTK